MKKNIYLLVLVVLFFSAALQAQVVFDFGVSTTVTASPIGYDKTGIGTYYKSTTGGTITDGTASCDGYTPSKVTSSSLFIFVADGDITEISVRGNGTGSNRTFVSLTTSTTLAGTYTAATANAVGTINGTTCGAIVITPTATIPAGTYMKFTFSGNLNVTSLLITAIAAVPPTVTTNVPVATNITSSTATLGGQITNTGSAAVTVSGICFSVNNNPTTADANTTNGPTAVGAISSSVTGLTFSTTYHARAYATSAAGTSYGTDQTFTTAVASSPTIIANPTSLNFGNALVGSTSSEKTFTMVAGGLTPTSGNISITAPAGYEVSATTTSGFATSISVPYTGSGLASKTIYVRFKPTALVPYSGNINLSGGAATANVAVTGNGSNVTYTVGDYGSVASDNWGNTSAWKIWDGSGFNTVAVAVPTTADNIWINSSDTIIVEASGKNCKNLYVNGRIKSNNKVNSPVYIKVYGSEINVAPGGLLGSASQTLGDAADGLSIDYFGTVSNPTNPVVTVTGGGTIGLSRFRTNVSFTTVTIDNNVTLNYHGSSNSGNAAGYYIASGDTSTLTINAGKTLTFAPWSCYTPVASSHTNGGAQTININGTLTFMPGNPAPDTVTVSRIGWHPSGYMSLGATANKPVNLNIGNGGILNATEFYPNGTKADNTMGSGGVIVITIKQGSIRVSKMADFRNPLQIVSTVLGFLNDFNLAAGAKIRIGAVNGLQSGTGQIQTLNTFFSNQATYAFEGIAAQITGVGGLLASISGLVINNPAGVTLSSPVTVKDSLSLINGNLTTTDANLLTVFAQAIFNGGSSISYVNGPIERYTLSTSSYLFPVGKSGSYHPFSITPIIGNFGIVTSFTGEYFKTTAASTTSVISPITSVGTNEYWDIIKNSGPDNARVWLNYNNTQTTSWSNTGSPTASQEIVVAHFTGGSWVDETSADGTSILGNATSGIVISQVLSSFSPFSFGLRPAGIIPVSLVSFNATLSNGQTKLYWTSNNEINVANYVVEKSMDGRSFSNLGNVIAINASSNSYSFTDINFITGVSYYRLKIMDRDGQFKYSNTIAINNQVKNNLTIFPNPVSNNLYVSFSKATEGATLEMYSMDGKKMNEYKLAKDAIQITINTATLPKGNYNLVLVNGDIMQHTQFIKQ